MKYLNPSILQKVLDSEIVDGAIDKMPEFTGLSVDSRTIRFGELFFAIQGDNNDGHDFIPGAFKNGAAAAVINRNRLAQFADNPPGLIYAVDDTHEALLNLAGYIRRQIDARFAGITGTNGKTTTKEMLYSIINVSHNAFRSPGNLNNLFGLPLSLGMMPSNVDYAVFELGISVPGEMARLASIIKPDIAVITNIGPAHLDTLRTMENVVKAKFELVDNLPVGAVVILNADDENLTKEAHRRNLKYIGFGISNFCDIRATRIEIDDKGNYSCDVNGRNIRVPVYGKVNIYNVLAAIAAATVWECPPDDWEQGFASFQPVDMRMVSESFEGLHLLIDCYNANPESVTASLETLSNIPTEGKRIAVMGDMLELGENEKEFHKSIGAIAAESGLDFLLCLGPLTSITVEEAIFKGLSDKQAMHCRDHNELLNQLLKIIRRGDLILFKGSRGMRIEKIVAGLKGTAFKNN
ncbi:MAG: UDP-N-acetylmuramoyl-tripeptide--D-alanyl-D-alanine ligase [candidate division Zixibacteria bacterium]